MAAECGLRPIRPPTICSATGSPRDRPGANRTIRRSSASKCSRPSSSSTAGDVQQLQVTASYSDSTTRDVTATAEYFSQQPGRLAGHSAGAVRALGEKGDGIVMVRYLGIVAVARFTRALCRESAGSALRRFRAEEFH